MEPSDPTIPKMKPSSTLEANHDRRKTQQKSSALSACGHKRAAAYTPIYGDDKCHVFSTRYDLCLGLNAECHGERMLCLLPGCEGLEKFLANRRTGISAIIHVGSCHRTSALERSIHERDMYAASKTLAAPDSVRIRLF